MKRSNVIWWLLGIGALIVLTGGAVVLADWKRGGEAYLPMLNAAESVYGIPRDLLARLAYQESHWRQDVITGARPSSAGALGLMQLVPQWHPAVDPLDVRAAITYAASYLKSLYQQFGSWDLALAAYNAGPGNVKKYGGIPPFPETQAYVQQITADIPV